MEFSHVGQLCSVQLCGSVIHHQCNLSALIVMNSSDYQCKALRYKLTLRITLVLILINADEILSVISEEKSL